MSTRSRNAEGNVKKLRDDSGKASKRCRCLIHDQLVENAPPSRLFKCDGKEVRKVVISAMRDQSMLSGKAGFVCETCYEKGKTISFDNEGANVIQPMHESEVQNPLQLKFLHAVQVFTNEVNEFIDADMDVNTETQVALETLMRLLSKQFIGKELRKMLQESDLKSQYRDSEIMKNMQSKDFLLNQNSLLISFLEGVMEKKMTHWERGKDYYSAAVAVESIYKMKNKTLVLPFSFGANLVQSLASGSKMVTNVTGRIVPGGVYTTYNAWLEEKGKNPLVCPQGDIDVFIDNLGKYIVKSWRVSATLNRSPNVITSVLHLILSNSPNLQQRGDIKPGLWCTDLTEELIQKKMEERIEKMDIVFRRARFRY